jgi:peroxiredoxin
VLAAMHGRERFAHSFALRVDDNKLPGTPTSDPSIFGGLDSFGEAISDHERIPQRPPAGVFEPSGTTFSVLDSIVNVDLLSGLTLEPRPPSRLQGRAQLQLSPPTIDVTDTSGKKVTVKMGLMSRYFPDPDTPRVAQFVRGELQITAAVNEVASQVGNVVDIDIKGDTVTSSFTPTFTSEPVSVADLAGVNQLIRNSLRTSFLPSNATLPSNIDHIQFKTLRGARNALAVLLNMDGPAGNPASQTNVFLAGGDDFALAAGVDFIRAKFQPTIDSILAEPIAPVSFSINLLLGTLRVSYTFTVNSVTLDLENGRMVLTTTGDAIGDNGPDFGFTVTQPLTLKVTGSTAELVVGDFSLKASNRIINRFTGRFKDRIRRVRDRAIDQSNVQDTVRKALSADAMLGGLLDSLLKPAHSKPGPQPRGFSLAYTSAEIRPSGIVLHGSLAVSAFPAPHVEFERIPPVTVGIGPGHITLPDFGPDYSALNSWIPGGTIQRYEWSSSGHTQPVVNDKTFVFVEPPPELSDGSPSTTPVSGYLPLCLRIIGTRPSPSGPVTAQNVSARACFFTSFPLVDVVAELEFASPTVSVTHPDLRGMIQVAGQTPARQAERGSGTPNLLVHFADNRSAGQLDILTQALRESGRDDATTAILAVLSPDQLSKTRYTAGVIYSEDRAGWERALGVADTKPPLTLIVGPKRHVAWKQEGEIDAGELAGALRKFLVAGKRVKVSVLRAKVRVGHLPPNFLFEHAPGRELTLRKLAGRAVTLVFWNSSSRQSIEAVRDAERARTSGNGQDAVVLAINDGEESNAAKQSAAANGLSATIVTDPKRQIAAAFGVNTWPTIVSIDRSGVVTSIRYGYSAEDPVDYPVQQVQSK